MFVHKKIDQTVFILYIESKDRNGKWGGMIIMSLKLIMGGVLALCFFGVVTAYFAGEHKDRCHGKKGEVVDLKSNLQQARIADKKGRSKTA